MKDGARGLVLAVSLAATSCGWHAGLTAPEGAASIGVEAARRAGTVLERGLEPEFTAALSQAVVDWVPLPLVAPDDADLVVRAEILEYRRRGGVRSVENELIETAVFVRAVASLVERDSGRTVGAPEVSFEWSGYALDDVAAEDEARARVLRHVAAALVLELFADEDAPE